MPGFERPVLFGHDPAPLPCKNWIGCVSKNDDATKDDNKRDLCTCGLAVGTHGRCCDLHEVCGVQVVVGDILWKSVQVFFRNESGYTV